MISPKGDGTYRSLAAAVLVAHQQTASSGCHCGGVSLGRSWAAHVAAVLDDAGALRTPTGLDPAASETNRQTDTYRLTDLWGRPRTPDGLKGQTDD